MKKGDIKVIIIVSLILVIGYGYLFYIGLNFDQKYVRIVQDQQVIHEIAIDDSYTNEIEVERDGTYNHIHFEGGKVWVHEANCFNQVCVYHKPISKVGETIVCIPHKLVIEIVGKSNDIDIIVD